MGSQVPLMDVRQRAVQITVDAAALRHNLELVRRRAPGANVFAVIKADAYGHGAIAVAQALDTVDGLAVVTCNEARALRAAGERRPILVMQGVRAADDAATCRALGLWPAVHHAAQLDAMLAEPGPAAPQAWLKVDTGMGRLGVLPDEVATLLARHDIDWQGVMAHLACADVPGNAHTIEQLARFDALAVPQRLAQSVSNSAALVAWPDINGHRGRHWVRPGLMLYGCNPLDARALPRDVQLAPAMHVTAPLISIKQMPANAGIGYAQRYRCPQPMRVGYAAVGYADGLPRVLDASADVSIDGRRCPIIGRVSMDSIAIDLRPLDRGGKTAAVGDRVTLWGPGQPVERLAAAAGTIAYELLTGIRGARRMALG